MHAKKCPEPNDIITVRGVTMTQAQFSVWKRQNRNRKKRFRADLKKKGLKFTPAAFEQFEASLRPKTETQKRYKDAQNEAIAAYESESEEAQSDNPRALEEFNRAAHPMTDPERHGEGEAKADEYIEKEDNASPPMVSKWTPINDPTRVEDSDHWPGIPENHHLQPQRGGTKQQGAEALGGVRNARVKKRRWAHTPRSNILGSTDDGWESEGGVGLAAGRRGDHVPRRRCKQKTNPFSGISKGERLSKAEEGKE